MKKYFITGFITLLPIALTIIIVLWLFNTFTEPLAGLIESIIHYYEKSRGIDVKHDELLVIILSRLSAFVLLMIIILSLGAFGSKFFFNLFLKIADKIFSRIPLIKTIYRLSIDFTQAMFTGIEKMFKETVVVPFPREDSYAVGFITGEVPESFKKAANVDLAVFVPTAPHPVSGFVLLSPKKMVTPVDVSIEDAFKFIISCGSIHPGESVSTPEKDK